MTNLLVLRVNEHRAECRERMLRILNIFVISVHAQIQVT